MNILKININTILENTFEFIHEQGGSEGGEFFGLFFFNFAFLLIEFPLQTNMNRNNKEKDNSLLRSTNRKRENTYNTPFIQKSKGI